MIPSNVIHFTRNQISNNHILYGQYLCRLQLEESVLPRGGKGCSLSYRFSFDLLEGDGSAGAFEHYRPSKVSSRSEAEVTDRSLPFYIVN